MNAVVDYGNTSAKVGIFDQQRLIEKHTFTSPDALRQFLEQTAFDNIIICSVNADAELIKNWAGANVRKFILSHTLPLPINILYSTPVDTQGVRSAV